MKRFNNLMKEKQKDLVKKQNASLEHRLISIVYMTLLKINRTNLIIQKGKIVTSMFRVVSSRNLVGLTDE